MVAAIDARETPATRSAARSRSSSRRPAGLGSYVQWDRRLDGRLAQAVMSIPAIKAVGIGIGAGVALLRDRRCTTRSCATEGEASAAVRVPGIRPTNRAGGLEGGVTNGEDARHGYMKPIATLMKPLRSVDLETVDVAAAIERSDVCAVPAAAVVAEAMVAIVIADAFLERFGGDTVDELKHRVRRVPRRSRPVHRPRESGTSDPPDREVRGRVLRPGGRVPDITAEIAALVQT